MSQSFEKSVKGGTKVKLAPPKSKYVEHILLATQSGEAGVAEVFRTLTHRLRDSTWTVAFKSLIIVHLMIKEGLRDVTLSYLAVSPGHRLAINSFTDHQTQGQNIRRYAEYLLARARAYEKTKVDYVRAGSERVRKLSVETGLLRETEIVQNQIKALLRCHMLDTDVENEISLTAFRLLTRDILDLFTVVNEAVMKVLQHYFEMSKTDAERAVLIYKDFCKQTELVVLFLKTAQQHQDAMRLEIPKIKHAPVDLAATLQEYLDDKDFEVHRRQYLAQQDAKKRGGKPVPTTAPTLSSGQSSKPVEKKPSAASTFTATSSETKGPAPDLIDFFESIEQNQQPLAQGAPQFQSQPTGFIGQQPQQTFQQPQSFQQPQTFQQALPDFNQQQQFNNFGASNGHNPYQQQTQSPPQVQAMQPNFTGAGFGGYGPQPQQSFQPVNAFAQDPYALSGPAAQTPSQLQPQSTNPFRKSMMPTATGGSGGFGGGQGMTSPIQPQNTNPFARSNTIPQVPPLPSNQIPQGFQQQQSQPPQQPQQQSPFAPQQPLQAQATGTNPFARQTATPLQQQQSPPVPQLTGLQVQPTGSTNPFRQATFVNQATGAGWQNTQQPTMGGLEQLPTMQVFPRPGQAQQQQPQQQASPWG